MATAMTLKRSCQRKYTENICTKIFVQIATTSKMLPRSPAVETTTGCSDWHSLPALRQPFSLSHCLALCLILLLPLAQSSPLSHCLPLFQLPSLPPFLLCLTLISSSHCAPTATAAWPTSCLLHCLPHLSACSFPLPHPTHSLQPRLTYVTSNGFLYFPFAIIAKN